MPAPDSVAQLVERFEQNRDAYLSGRYNETPLRREFIDPFFSALGWDIANVEGSAEAYKDVVHEDAIKIGGATKAPDYCFRYGGARKFFVEAKKPSVDIRADAASAYQLRRYAWSAKLPLSILTNFQDLAVYDCRVRPAPTDKASAARVMLLTCAEYLPRWDDLAAIFSRESVRKGSFDQYAESTRRKAGTAEVDDAFLAEIEAWRDELARHIALRNPGLTQRQLNFAVQVTIDRIVFLRIAEDRGIEPYGRLMALLNGDRVYRRLFELFQHADERYNSGLFHFQPERDRPARPDILTPSLQVDDRPLKEILRRLYYPESPYEFAVIPPDILGQVYEQFLGKIIRLTAGHRAVVEEKPEVRKAGGVYYTPTHIVDYIVRHTLGPLLGGSQSSSSSCSSSSSTPSSSSASGDKTKIEDENEDDDEDDKKGRPQGPGAPPRRRPEISPKQVSRLRILDPACGSGSFLLGAYQVLLDWHLAWYTAHDPEKWATGRSPALFQVPNPQSEIRNTPSSWRLTTAERKRILLNNLYGVDIDPQAVEVTKLSLLLKVLEGESGETLERQFALFHERALPDLASNIKCGNSLIGPEFYNNHQGTLFDEEAMLRVGLFDWQEEFAGVMKAGGFDAVIGNPPYIRIQTLTEVAPLEVAYYRTHYRTASRGNYDLYVVFVERGLQLLSPKGRLGYILPGKFLSTDYGRELRGLLAEARSVERIVDFGHDQVFANSTTYTCLLFLDRAGPPWMSYLRAHPDRIEDAHAAPRRIRWNTLEEGPWVFLDRGAQTLVEKTRGCGVTLLRLRAAMSRGISTGADDVFCLVDQGGTLRTRSGEIVDIERQLLRRPLYATDYTRYCFRPRNEERIIFPYLVTDTGYTLIDETTLRTGYPKAYAYLRAHKRALDARKQSRDWHGFSAPRSLHLHDRSDLIVPLLADRGLCAPMPASKTRFCVMASAGCTLSLPASDPPLDAAYLLGLLNSKLLFWVLRQVSNKFRGGWVTCTKQYFGQLPIRTLDLSKPADRRHHDQMVHLVDRMASLQVRLSEAGTEHEQTALSRQIQATDSQIDRLVYQLYALTEVEVRIVEEADAPQPSSG